jgi:predicted dehydrogenase
MHALAYKLVERGDLVACCDRLEERREQFAQEFGLKPYADLEEMVEAEKIDLIHLVTLPDTRVELMTRVGECGVPACIVEKPIACQVADWRALCELEARTQTRFAVGQQFRYHPNLTRCREALRSGELGRVLFLDFTAGMNVSGQGTHIIDWAMSLNDDAPVVRVFGAASGAQGMADSHPAPDGTAAQVLFANGVTGLWVNGLTAPRVGDRPETWAHCRVAAYAERGRTLYEEFGKWEIVSADGQIQSGAPSAEEILESNHAAQAGLTDSMFEWLEDDAKPSGTSLARALHQWHVVLGLYAGALRRKPVDIPFDPPDDLFSLLHDALRE